MTDYTQGTTQPLTALFFSSPGVPVAVDNLSLTVVSLTDGSTALGPVTTPFINTVVGAYIYNWAISLVLPVSQYLVTWTGDVGGVPIVAAETIVVVAPAAGTGTGPCETYPYILPCDISTASAAITGVALQAATELLYLATAQRFGGCSVTLRPCRDNCYSWPLGQSGYGYPQWWDSGYPWPVNRGGGVWVNMACGICGDGCACASVSQVTLPGPVQSVSEVIVDGVVLTPGIDYRVDDYRKLVRLGGEEWPLCNNYNLETTEVGTWSVTAVYGEPFPEGGLGEIAMGELICAFVSDLTGGECALPPNITELTRQGISMSFNDVNEVLETGFTGLKWVDQFIRRWNPNGLMARSFIMDLDGPTYRRTGTA